MLLIFNSNINTSHKLRQVDTSRRTKFEAIKYIYMLIILVWDNNLFLKYK